MSSLKHVNRLRGKHTTSVSPERLATLAVQLQINGYWVAFNGIAVFSI